MLPLTVVAIALECRGLELLLEIPTALGLQAAHLVPESESLARRLVEPVEQASPSQLLEGRRQIFTRRDRWFLGGRSHADSMA